MKENFFFLTGLISKFVLPNALITFMLVSWFYYESAQEGGSPTWRAVAVGSMAIVGSLDGLGYRDFVNRMKHIETAIKKDQELRDQQHKSNVAAIIALALAGQDKEKIEEVIEQLLKSKPYADYRQ